MTDLCLLLVEDEPELRNQLVQALSESAHHLKLDACGDIQTANFLIERNKYDGAILDLCLPPAPNGVETVDVSLCRMLRHTAHVWHITAYRDNPDVEEHIREHPKSQRGDLFYKGLSGGGVTRDLVETVLEILPQERIAAKLALLEADDDGQDLQLVRHLRADPALPSVTALLPELCGEISCFWRDLHPSFQDRIRRFFVVRDDRDPVEVHA